QGLGPQLKAAFEQIFAPPVLARLLLAEVGPEPSSDILVKLGFDGSFEILRGGVAVVADQPEKELPAQERLRERLLADFDPARAAAELLREWPRLGDSPGEAASAGDAPPARLPATSRTRIVEAALLRRDCDRVVRYEPLDAAALGLEGQPPSPLA
ncbi:MAG: hypothetical protein JNL97_05815, partial [Verrucomicrobiales bacterium]|nr:hypothetical protein [Verrucomicrobiales bacterium]